MSIKKREVVSHPGLVKFISLITALFMLGTFVVNGYVMAAGYQLSWGFYPDRMTPDIRTWSNSTDFQIYIPAYVNNTGMFGFDVKDLQIEVSISYADNDSVITSSSSSIGNIPWGTSTGPFNMSLMSDDAVSLMPILNGTTTAFVFAVFFHVSYAFATTTLSAAIELPAGGLVFP
jgi:hypothetical protein